MMVLKIVAIYDAKVEAYMTPVFVRSAGEAVRSFGDAVNNPETEFNKHPEDYSIFELGDFYTQTGDIVVLKAPECLAHGHILKEVVE